MKRYGLLLAAGLLCVPAAEGQRGGLGAWFNNEIRVGITTRLVPSGKQIPSGMVATSAAGLAHRVLGDRRGPIFGYDLEARRAGDRYTIRLLPIAAEFERELQKEYPGGMPQGHIPTFEAPREIAGVKEGDSVEVELLSNADNREKIVDVLRVTVESPPWAAPARNEFALDRVSITMLGGAGKEQYRQQWAEKKINLTGAAARIYLMGWGAFLLTLEPHPGFEPAGIADGQRLTFVWNNHLFEIVSQSNILSHAPFGRVWIKLDPSYMPPDDPVHLSLATADKIDYLLPK